jgi:hypothetical protein
MFIEPAARRTLKLQRSEHAGFAEKDIALRRRESFLRLEL